MKKVRCKAWYLVVSILIFGCSSFSSKKTFTITYFTPPKKNLTTKPILVSNSTGDGYHLKNILTELLMNSGYEVIQDVNSTGKLIAPFGIDQAVPTKDVTEITVSLELEKTNETSRKISEKITLTSCNYLRDKNPCSSRSGIVRSFQTTLSKKGQAKIRIEDSGKETITIEFPINVKTTGLLPGGMNIHLTQAIQNILRKTFAPHLKSLVQEQSTFEIDKMAADFIDSGIFEIAKLRVQGHESGVEYYLTMGYIEEKKGNLSGANMYYQEGEVSTRENELFKKSIERINFLLQQ